MINVSATMLVNYDAILESLTGEGYVAIFFCTWSHNSECKRVVFIKIHDKGIHLLIQVLHKACKQEKTVVRFRGDEQKWAAKKLMERTTSKSPVVSIASSCRSGSGVGSGTGSCSSFVGSSFSSSAGFSGSVGASWLYVSSFLSLSCFGNRKSYQTECYNRTAVALGLICRTGLHSPLS